MSEVNTKKPEQWAKSALDFLEQGRILDATISLRACVESFEGEQKFSPKFSVDEFSVEDLVVVAGSGQYRMVMAVDEERQIIVFANGERATFASVIKHWKLKE